MALTDDELIFAALMGVSPEAYEAHKNPPRLTPAEFEELSTIEALRLSENLSIMYIENLREETENDD